APTGIPPRRLAAPGRPPRQRNPGSPADPAAPRGAAPPVLPTPSPPPGWRAARRSRPAPRAATAGSPARPPAPIATAAARTPPPPAGTQRAASPPPAGPRSPPPAAPETALAARHKGALPPNVVVPAKAGTHFADALRSGGSTKSTKFRIRTSYFRIIPRSARGRCADAEEFRRLVPGLDGGGVRVGCLDQPR